MTAFYGMDTEQVRSHADRLRHVSGDVQGLRERLDAVIRSTAWEGPDAEDFRGRWDDLAATHLSTLCDDLTTLGDRALGEADEQDVVSDRDGPESGPAETPGSIPDAVAADMVHGYLEDDSSWLPDWLEGPAEGALSDVARLASDAIGWGVDGGIDLLETGLGGLGVNTDGIAQFQRDANHAGGILEDWATGERVPTYAELVSAGLVTTGSAGVGVYEAVTGNDTAFLDDRPGGIVEGVETSTEPVASPQDLGDLVIGNDALRMSHDGGALESGQIGIQEVRSADGGDPSYIVQVPPTEGAGLGEVPEAYGGQGNSRDWGSNLRLVAGQHPAAMDDVRAAMEEAGVPDGSNVMFVGHSQGGIVASHLAADPPFNSSSGESGTYNVTHSFSVGSPVQTVVPAQGSTEVVNVAHGPVGLDPHGVGEVPVAVGGPIGQPVEVPVPTDVQYTGDPIAQSDLQGAQVGDGSLQAPNVHEVVLEGCPGRVSDGTEPLFGNHDSYDPNDPAYGYYGSVQAATGADPVLSGLQEDISGSYIGDGTYVAESHVVTVGRGEH
ncbi:MULTISPECIES: WXG100 family type VII secretion target [unclassified Brachybacterium]|uniref:WXG100 family type VII secretion target n=1 Tax=unclassified Brachybacterium TaxID=2623841 RepID=UPI00361D9EBE